MSHNSTTLKVSDTTLARLDERKKDDEAREDVIQRLLEASERESEDGDGDDSPSSPDA